MIGVLGGTFDPVHNGHLGIARDAQEALGLSQIRFIPLFQAVHKDQPSTSAELRLDMLNQALEGQSNWVSDDREITRSGPSYSVDTLRSLKKAFPNETICLIVGTDAFEHFLSWKEPKAISELCHIIVLQRPDYTLAHKTTLQQFATPRTANQASDLSQKSAGLIYFIALDPQNISSSDIREKVASKQNIDDLCPKSVIKLIEKHRLYCQERAR